MAKKVQGKHYGYMIIGEGMGLEEGIGYSKTFGPYQYELAVKEFVQMRTYAGNVKFLTLIHSDPTKALHLRKGNKP